MAQISKAWQSCSNAKTAFSDDELIGGIADELLASIEEAIRLDATLSGETERRAYLRIAEAEAIAIVTRYSRAHSRRRMTESDAASLIRMEPARARGFFQHNDLNRNQDQNEVIYVWSEVALAYAITEMKKLADGKRKSMKLHATAEVMLARLLLLKGDKVEARRQLRQGWDPIKDSVENTILHDAVAEVRMELGSPEALCSVELVTEHSFPTWKEMETKLHKDIIKALREEGLKDEAIAHRLDISKGTLTNWLKDLRPPKS